MPRYRIAVDTGGTFSDFVYLNEDTGAVAVGKIPSTPDDPSRAILQGIEALIGQGVPAADVGYFCHGTTVGTNALLEGKGVKTGLLVTEGFRGIYEVAEQARPYGPAIFDVMYDKPTMLVPQSLTGEVRERVDFRGNVLVPLDEAALRETLRGLKAQNIEALAVCLLFSFLHPEHEARRARDRQRGNAGLRCLAVQRNPAADPRVLPAEHDGHQRLSAADPRALCREPRSPPRRRRRHHAAEIHHAVERRHVDVSGRSAHRRHHGAVRARRRRYRRRRRLRHDRLPQHHHLRHGRHLVRCRADQGRPADLFQPRQDRRPRHRRADDGHQHGERRRRHHRQGRSLRRARSRPAQRRRRAGAGLLRPRRRGGDHHRLQSRARLSQRR